jgi:uncharacterized membrane protein
MLKCKGRSVLDELDEGHDLEDPLLTEAADHEHDGHSLGGGAPAPLIQPPVSGAAWMRRRDVSVDAARIANWRLRAATEKSARKFFLMLILSGSFFIAEMVFGVLSGSLAVLADAFHMLTDVVALVCGHWIARLGLRQKTLQMSYGWQRAEVVGALCNACFLTAVCFTVTLQAVEKLCGVGENRDADLLQNADKIIVLGCVGIGINLGGMCIFGGISPCLPSHHVSTCSVCAALLLPLASERKRE